MKSSAGCGRIGLKDDLGGTEMTREIAIVGIGETPPVRRSGRSLRAMVVDAVLAALDDAGVARRRLTVWSPTR